MNNYDIEKLIKKHQKYIFNSFIANVSAELENSITDGFEWTLNNMDKLYLAKLLKESNISIRYISLEDEGVKEVKENEDE